MGPVIGAAIDPFLRAAQVPLDSREEVYGEKEGFPVSAQSPSFTEMTIAGTSCDDIYSLALIQVQHPILNTNPGAPKVMTDVFGLTSIQPSVRASRLITSS